MTTTAPTSCVVKDCDDTAPAGLICDLHQRAMTHLGGDTTFADAVQLARHEATA